MMSNLSAFLNRNLVPCFLAEVCAFDSTAAGLCPGTSMGWGNTVVDGPGTYHYIGTLNGECQTLEVLDVQFLDPPSLYWILEGAALQSAGGWTDHTWSLNGSALEATGSTLALVGASVRSAHVRIGSVRVCSDYQFGSS